MKTTPKPDVAYKIEKLNADILANKDVYIQITQKEREEYKEYTRAIFEEKLNEIKEFKKEKSKEKFTNR